MRAKIACNKNRQFPKLKSEYNTKQEKMTPKAKRRTKTQFSRTLIAYGCHVIKSSITNILINSKVAIKTS